MANDSELENRVREYGQAFRRQANPPANLPNTLMARVSEGRAPGRLIYSFAMAAGVVAVVMLLAFGAWQLRYGKVPAPVVTPPVGFSPTPTLTATPTPSASPTPTPTPTATQTPRPAGAPMQLIDITFADTAHGWAIGSICSQPDNCPLQLRITTDGGRTWFAGNPPAVQALGVDPGWQLRFVSAQVGYLYGPSLYRTGDGGQTWTNAGLAHSTLSLTASGNSAWAIEADCSQGQCLRMTLYTSQDQGASWSRSSAQPAMVGQQAQVLRVGDSLGWVLSFSTIAVPSGSLDSALAVTRDGGRSWQRLVRPCAPQTSIQDTAAALPDGSLWIVCGGDHAMGQERKQVIVSHDGGAHWSFPPDAPLPGFVGELALSGPSHAWMTGTRSPLYESTNGGASWTTADSRGVPVDLSGPGITHVVFIDAQHGWAATDNEVFWTSDGGAHWGHTAI